jgi:hypothetical protein
VIKTVALRNVRSEYRIASHIENQEETQDSRSSTKSGLNTGYQVIKSIRVDNKSVAGIKIVRCPDTSIKR